MKKEMEEFYFAIGEGGMRYSEILIVKVSGSDLYVFNSSCRGSYHVSLHADGHSHMKIDGKGSLRLISKEEKLKPGKAFMFRRSLTQDRPINPLNILIGTIKPWAALMVRNDVHYEELPIPASGKVAHVAVYYSNNVDITQFKEYVRKHRNVIKIFPVHNGSLYALVYSEIDDPGVHEDIEVTPESVTPADAPVDKDWKGEKYVVSVRPHPSEPPAAALMALVHNLPG